MHGIGTGTQTHIGQILMAVGIGHNRTGARIVLQVPEHSISLRQPDITVVIDMMNNPIQILTLPVLVMLGYLSDLIPICLTDGTITDIPGIPDMRVELRQIGGLLLVDPQNLINGVLDALLPKGHNRN